MKNILNVLMTLCILSVVINATSISIGAGYATITEARSVNLNNGIQKIDFNMPYKILPESVVVSSNCFTTLSQHYDPGTTTFVEKTITVTMINGAVYTGKILSGGFYSGNALLLETADKTFILPMDQISLIEYSGTSSPMLKLNTNSNCNGQNTANILYMTTGLDWSAQYNAVFKNNRLILNGLAQITNNAGDFENADVTLISGNINRVSKTYTTYDYDRYMYAEDAVPMSAGGYSSTEEASAFEYHAYNIPGKTSLNYGETTVVSLVDIEIPAQKKYTYTVPYSSYGTGSSVPVDVSLEFENSLANGGVELPAGTVRVYTDNGFGGYMLAGEDRISNTPLNEIVTLNIGKAFDVTAETTRTDQTRQGRSEYISQSVKLSNTKNEDVTVEVIGSMTSYSNWEIKTSNLPYKKESSSRAKWTINVPAGQEVTLTYTVHRWW
ncbi:DUF4139 domain-containing protein [Candidatus Micrarchaeota archaeon]|nr:DUF4139 domain-containing protein [Candidatus Micrarchaeota archaeon]